MKINVEIKVSVNSGAALFLWVLSFFGICFASKVVPAVAASLILTLAALTTGFGGYLKKRDSNNQIALKAEVAGLTKGKTGDPLT